MTRYNIISLSRSIRRQGVSGGTSKPKRSKHHTLTELSKQNIEKRTHTKKKAVYDAIYDSRTLRLPIKIFLNGLYVRPFTGYHFLTMFKK
jgi:hypothetical protein